jgi:hypothetical protein
MERGEKKPYHQSCTMRLIDEITLWIQPREFYKGSMNYVGLHSWACKSFTNNVWWQHQTPTIWKCIMK